MEVALEGHVLPEVVVSDPVGVVCGVVLDMGPELDGVWEDEDLAVD